jgi:hypothetical protein
MARASHTWRIFTVPLIEDLYAKQRAKQVELVPFFYSTSFAATVLTGGVTVAQNISIQSDSHFIVRYINYTTYTGSGGTFVVSVVGVPLLINFFDTGSGRTLQDTPQPIQNLAGGSAAIGGSPGQLPFILPEPWLVRAGGVIQVGITNLNTLLALRLDVSLIGFKAFRFGMAQPADI